MSSSYDAYMLYRRLMEEKLAAERQEPVTPQEPEPEPEFDVSAFYRMSGQELLDWYLFQAEAEGKSWHSEQKPAGLSLVVITPWIGEDPKWVYLLTPGWEAYLEKEIREYIDRYHNGGGNIGEFEIKDILWDRLYEYRVG